MMAETSARQVRPEPEADGDPLDYWLAQERDPGIDDSLLDLAADRDRNLPGGWWLLPMAVIAVPTWATILWMIFG